MAHGIIDYKHCQSIKGKMDISKLCELNFIL